MVSVLQQVPATVYVAFATSIATLGGVLITNKANSNRLLSQFNHEKDKLLLQLEHDKNSDRQELLRGKLEELYILFRSSHDDLLFNFVSMHKNRGGTVGFSSSFELRINMVLDYTVPLESLHRIEMLINLYFPSLKDNYEKVVQARSEANKIMWNSSQKNDDLKDYLSSFEDAITRFHRQSEQFIKLISEHIKSI